MYIPIDNSVELKLPENIVSNGAVEESGSEDAKQDQIVCICANREKQLIAIVTRTSINIYLAHPQLLLCVIYLTGQEIRERGFYDKLYWRMDSTSIAVTMTSNHVLIYRVEFNNEDCYQLVDPRDGTLKRVSQELFLRCNRPSLKLFPSVVVNLADRVSSCISAKEELFVCVRNGYMHHVEWTGKTNPDSAIRLNTIPFSHDQMQSKSEYVSNPEVHIVDAAFAPLLGGHCIVLSDGRAALLTSSDAKFCPGTVLAVWAFQLKDAVCTDVNHKFRLLMFGCSNGDVCAYNLDDATGSLLLSFRVTVSVTNGPELSNRLGRVTRIRVLPSGCAFAAIWGPPDLPSPFHQQAEALPLAAVFTPFGAQTWCSLEGDEDAQGCYTAIDWGTEGYYLWLGSAKSKLRIFPMARSAALQNPVMEHNERVVLLSGDRVLLSPPRQREVTASAPHSVWTTLQVPHEYLASNWPLRYASLDREHGKTLVVAGNRGIAHCNVATGRWKIFGNESQERELIVTGGVCIFGETIGVVGCDAETDDPQLRFYPTATRLDNRFASRHGLNAKGLIMAHRQDVLGIFDIASNITLYKLQITNGGDHPKVSVDVVVEIRINDMIVHPACLVSLQLTQLNFDNNQSHPTSVFTPGIDTILVNLSGRLVTLNTLINNENGKFSIILPKRLDHTEHGSEVRIEKVAEAQKPSGKNRLNQPMLVASYVEQVWHDRANWDEIELIKSGEKTRNGKTAHLSNALWIMCGARGLKVWLPLLPNRRTVGQQEMSFIARRIMLTFALDIYPCVICPNDCLALGVESLFVNVTESSRLYSLQRNCEVFVHHLLKQLLKRNLGVFALEVAASCRKLAHFPHALELLLHDVLEEEATSSEPIPDPLLPRCIAFIQEFPEFLQTVAHCARKTELALWPSLFSVTASPNDLFEACIREGQLNTAASYLIVLQTMENSQTSQEQAARLLRETLSSSSWSIARDIVRFARAIDSEDMDSPVRSPAQSKAAGSRRATGNLEKETSEFVFNRFQVAARVTKVRHHSRSEKESGSRKDSSGSAGGRKVTRAASNEISPPSPISPQNPLAEIMDQILNEHAMRLLEDYCIRDLGFFSSELGVDIPCLFTTTRQFPAKKTITDFCLALTRLHSQFEWPYPVASRHVVDQLERRFASMRCSRSTASLNGAVAGIGTLSDLGTEGESPSISSSARRKEEKETANGNGKEDESQREPSIDNSSTVIIQEARLTAVNENGQNQKKNRNDEGSSNTPRSGRTSPSGSAVGVVTGSDAVMPLSSVEMTTSWHALDPLVQDNSPSGSSSTVRTQMMHLLEMFKECGSSDWVLLLSLVSRDLISLRRALTRDWVLKWGSDSLNRTRFGCNHLLQWAMINCLGYVCLVQQASAHLEIVAEQCNCPSISVIVETYSREAATATKQPPAKEKVEINGKPTCAPIARKENESKSKAALWSAFEPPAQKRGSRMRERSRSCERLQTEDAVAEEQSQEGCTIS
ncbi:hypothetical protein WR25_21295 [Diploscapter pachys]|uniref:Protein RIC1 homolog n=1 Tax=Diploscapter pachys TaxID=2018661 RepID=A0A2A2LHB1_9BILA|nr:hypothetical protein WR25_21295 [Diploscapter pachys]